MSLLFPEIVEHSTTYLCEIASVFHHLQDVVALPCSLSPPAVLVGGLLDEGIAFYPELLWPLYRVLQVVDFTIDLNGFMVVEERLIGFEGLPPKILHNRTLDRPDNKVKEPREDTSDRYLF